jgi:small conductance mechanosensitive channel
VNGMNVKDQIISFLVRYGFQIFGSIIILVAGLFCAKLLARLVKRLVTRFHLEPPVENLLVLLARVLVIVIAGVLAVSNLGVNISPLVTGIGVVGVGIGLATQGVLSNVVAGVVIMFSKPFRVTEYIELLGVDGVVEKIDLFSTHLRHFDKSIVVIPNKKISGEILHNYGTVRQVDLAIGVAYDSDLKATETAIRGTLLSNTRVKQDIPAVVAVGGLANGCVTWNVRPWVNVQDFPPASGELYSALLKNLAAAGIELAYPQREIRILNDATSEPRNVARVAAGI